MHQSIISMTFGKYTYGSPLVKWENKDASLTVGNFCSIAGGVKIYLGGNHRSDRITTYPFGHLHKNVFSSVDGSGHPCTKGNVVIGHDVWIGDNVTIMSGVTVGSGAILANNSHIVKNVEPYSITGGNPAKLIKYRFTTEQIEELLRIQWWHWDDAKINKYAPLLCDTNIDAFIHAATTSES